MMTPSHRVALLAVALSLAPLTGFAVDDAAVLRCRAITDAAPRLACYDALQVASAGVPAVRSETRAVAPASAAVAATATATTAAATGAATPAQRDFGLPAGTNAPDSIESTIPGPFQGWDPDEQITLANGQVWRIADGSRTFVKLNSPKVRVVKGILGAFYLEVDGMNQRPRVRRVK